MKSSGNIRYLNTGIGGYTTEDIVRTFPLFFNTQNGTFSYLIEKIISDMGDEIIINKEIKTSDEQAKLLRDKALPHDFLETLKNSQLDYEGMRLVLSWVHLELLKTLRARRAGKLTKEEGYMRVRMLVNKVKTNQPHVLEQASQPKPHHPSRLEELANGHSQPQPQPQSQGVIHYVSKRPFEVAAHWGSFHHTRLAEGIRRYQNDYNEVKRLWMKYAETLPLLKEQYQRQLDMQLQQLQQVYLRHKAIWDAKRREKEEQERQWWETYHSQSIANARQIAVKAALRRQVEENKRLSAILVYEKQMAKTQHAAAGQSHGQQVLPDSQSVDRSYQAVIKPHYSIHSHYDDHQGYRSYSNNGQSAVVKQYNYTAQQRAAA